MFGEGKNPPSLLKEFMLIDLHGRYLVIIGEKNREGSHSHSFVDGIRGILLREVVSRVADSFLTRMGGDSVTTEPVVLKIDEDVKVLLEKAGLLDFF